MSLTYRIREQARSHSLRFGHRLMHHSVIVGDDRGYEGSECGGSFSIDVTDCRIRQQAGSHKIQLRRNILSDRPL
jgi:hypothetical protein